MVLLRVEEGRDADQIALTTSRLAKSDLVLLESRALLGRAELQGLLLCMQRAVRRAIHAELLALHLLERGLELLDGVVLWREGRPFGGLWRSNGSPSVVLLRHGEEVHR